MSGEREWLTVGRAAEILGLDVQTVRRRADSGELGDVWWTQPGRRGQRRISAAGVEAYRRRLRGSEQPAEDSGE